MLGADLYRENHCDVIVAVGGGSPMDCGKGIGIVVLLALAPRLVRTATDGLLLGAFIGLGFQTSEDFLYSVVGATQGFT